MFEFAQSLDTIDRVVAAVTDAQRVLFDTSWKEDLEGRIRRAMTDQHAQLLGTAHPGVLVASQGVGWMSVSNELLARAQRLRGTPIIDAPTSWQYFVWKLQYDAERSAGETHTDLANLHVVRGLQSLAENEMEWLGSIPPRALIEVRKSNAIAEIRQILGKGVNEVALATPTNFYRTADEVFDNIHAAFDEHRRNIRELTAKKWKFAGSDVGSWLVVGSLAVTAAATGQPVWGLAAIAADQLLAAPKLRNIPTSIKDLATESQKLKRSPVGMLFSCSRGRA